VRTFRCGAGLFAVALSFAGLAGCSSPQGPTSPSGPSGPTGVLVGAGDIGSCDTNGAALTGRLLDEVVGTVFAAGDNAYWSGTTDEYQACYDPFWGRQKARTRPVPGNHDYLSPGAAPYYAYFGANAGTAGAGYYSYIVGAWLILALNSEIDHGPGSPQMRWLTDELAAYRGTCAAAIWHRPLFTSGKNLDNPDMLPVWQALYDANVDVVINGHDHMYERFARQDPFGRSDPARGIQQFTVGTGGAPLYDIPGVHVNSEVRGSAWGVMVFTLAPTSYSWQFRPVAGASFTDTGTGLCH
jgi:hypothetical protein